MLQFIPLAFKIIEAAAGVYGKVREKMKRRVEATVTDKEFIPGPPNEDQQNNPHEDQDEQRPKP